METESFNQNIAEYHQKITDKLSHQKESDSSLIPQILSLDDAVDLYCLSFDEIIKENIASPNSLNKGIFKRKHLTSVILDSSVDEKLKDKYCDFIDMPNGQHVLKKTLRPLIGEFFGQKRLSEIYHKSPELKQEKYVTIEGKQKNAGQYVYQVRYVFESCVYICSYTGNRAEKTKDCGWKLTDDDINTVVLHLEGKKLCMPMPFITTFKVTQEPASMRFFINPIVSSESSFAVKDSLGFACDLQCHICPELEPDCLDWKYYCDSQSNTESIADRLIYIIEASNGYFGNKVVGCLALKENSKPADDVIAEAADEFVEEMRQKELQGIPQRLKSLASKVIGKPDLKLYSASAEVSAADLFGQFNEQYAQLEKGNIELKYYPDPNGIGFIGFDVNDEIGFDLINRKFSLDPSKRSKLKQIDAQAKALPDIDKAISFAKSTSSAKGINFDDVATLDFRKTLFRIEIDDGITKKQKLSLNYNDSSSWTKSIAKFLNDCYEKTQKKRDSLQKQVNESGLVGNIIATAIADIVLKNEKKDGRYHLTANNCAALLRDMSTANKFYSDINHTRYDKLFRLIPRDEVERIIEQVVDRGLVDESYHRISDYNVVYYSLVPGDCTKLFLSSSLASTKLSTDFGLLARLKELTDSSDESASDAEIDDKSYIKLLQSLANHPAVWCYKPEPCRQFLQLKPEMAKKLLKVYGALEDDSFKKKYLKLLAKETKNDKTH